MASLGMSYKLLWTGDIALLLVGYSNLHCARMDADADEVMDAIVAQITGQEDAQYIRDVSRPHPNPAGDSIGK